MATTSPARIDDDLYASAKIAGAVQSRSASQQVAHWARVGREIEASASISHKDIAEVLAGSRSYDMLSAKEQAVVRAEWSVRMHTRREALDLAEHFATSGRTWVELDDDGDIVERGNVPVEGATDEGQQAPDRGRTGRGRSVAKTADAGVVAKPGKGFTTSTSHKAPGRGAADRSAG